MTDGYIAFLSLKCAQVKLILLPCVQSTRSIHCLKCNEVLRIVSSCRNHYAEALSIVSAEVGSRNLKSSIQRSLRADKPVVASYVDVTVRD